MGTVFGQVGFGDRSVDNHRCEAALFRKPNLWPTPQVLYDTPRFWGAGRGGEAASEDGERRAVIDGALYSTADVARVLGAPPTAGSAELLLRAWDRWGEDAPRRVNGDFAAVLHSPASTILLRDHIGTRPIYWHWADGRLSFATLLPDLLALLPHPPMADEGAIAAFLRWPTALGPHTLLKGVQSLEPGHALFVTGDGPRTIRWWQPENRPDVRFSNEADYGAALRELADLAVADRLPATGGIGAHLSGGFDSTAVAVMAEEALGRQGRKLVATYSWSPPISDVDPMMDGADERPRIAEIAGPLGLTHRYCGITGERMLASFSRPIETEGLADVSDEFMVLEHARRDGVQTLLSGWGGDEAFSAHAHGVPAWLLASGRLGRLIGLARANGGFRRPARMAGFLWHGAGVPLLPDALFDWLGPYDDLYGDGCYLSRRLAALPPLPGLPGPARFTARPSEDIRRALDQRHLGERMATWAAWGTAHGIEYRYPLTDRRILEFILGVPPDILWGDRQPRYFARATLRGRLKGRLGKSDPANERRRLRSLQFCWQQLGREAAAGVFDGHCDWLDMQSLRRDLLCGPSGQQMPDILAFARIMPAIRIWHMAHRLGAVEPAKATA